MKDFGRFLRSARNAKGFTQQQMADKLGVSLRLYQTYEQGKNTDTFDRLVKMADILEVSTDYLLGRSEDR